MSDEITTSNPHSYEVGETIELFGLYRPWWRKVLDYFFGVKRIEYTITKVTNQTFEYKIK